MIKLPRKVEADPRKTAIESALAQNLRALWEKGTVQVPRISLGPELERTLVAARDFRQLECGLEKIEGILESEKRGLDALQAKQGIEPAGRASRLLLIANDGAERFYRACETILLRHGDRVLCLLVDEPAERFSLKLFGADRQVKAILLSEREAVTQALFALAPKSPR